MLSAFQDKLLELYTKQTEFIRPETRRNEVMSFVRGGLRDLSISRSTFSWGIPVPDDPKHVIYVWLDALANYITAIGVASSDKADQQKFEKYWPADLQMIGKEIVRFHCVYWPAFLMAAGLPLPKSIVAHGWLLFEENKMSKSRGNIVRTETILDVLGADALRYFLLREVVFGQDGSFSYDALVGRYNSDLANGLGNLASRTLAMIHQYRGGAVPNGSSDSQIARTATDVTQNALEAFDRFEFSKALESVWSLISAVDKFIVERAPWKLAKSPDATANRQLDETLYTSAEALRVITALLSPVIPESAAKIWSQLGLRQSIDQVRTSELHWRQLRRAQLLGAVPRGFPHAD